MRQRTARLFSQAKTFHERGIFMKQQRFSHFFAAFSALLLLVCLSLTACGSKQAASNGSNSSTASSGSSSESDRSTSDSSTDSNGSNPSDSSEKTETPSTEPAQPLEDDAHAYTLKRAGGTDLTVVLEVQPFSDFQLSVDQILVYEGSKLVQTMDISALDYANSDYLFDGLFEDVESGGVSVDVQDLNFDGTEDLGIMCGMTYNGPRLWFFWDEDAKQLQPDLFTSLDLTVDTENQQIIDTWRDGNVGTDTYTYAPNAQGKLVLESMTSVQFTAEGTDTYTYQPDKQGNLVLVRKVTQNGTDFSIYEPDEQGNLVLVQQVSEME
jgi:hypothetical protein